MASENASERMLGMVAVKCGACHALAFDPRFVDGTRIGCSECGNREVRR